MPEVGGDARTPAHLRRAGDVDDHAGELLFCVPRVKQADCMVLVAFHMAEVGTVGGAVHSRGAVGVCRQPIVPHDGMAQAEAHSAGPAVLPRPLDRPGNSPGRERHVVGRGHGAQVDAPARPCRRNVDAVGREFLGHVGHGAGFRRGMGMGRVQHDSAGVDLRQRLAHHRPNPVPQIVADRDQVNRHHDDPLGRFAVPDRFEDQGRRGDRVHHAGGNPGTGEAGQYDGILGRDVSRCPSDAESIRHRLLGTDDGRRDKDRRQDGCFHGNDSSHGFLLVHGRRPQDAAAGSVCQVAHIGFWSG
jgi:hypothetical protein